MTAIVVAAAASAATVLLLWPARSRLRPRGPASPRGRELSALLGAAAVVLVLLPGRLAVLVLLAAGTAVGGHGLWRRRQRRTAAAVAQRRVLETCDLLAAELGAGLPPGRALRRSADAWPHLRPVAEAFDLGGDVPGAWRHAGSAPGARDLRLLAAAWAVAHRTGHGLADAVAHCADALRAAAATRRVVESELASARATARLVAGLPVAAWVMGSGNGGDPLGFLTGHPLGLACLGGGLLLGLTGLWWIEAIADDVERSS